MLPQRCTIKQEPALSCSILNIFFFLSFSPSESITEELSKLSSPEPSLLQDSVSLCSLGSLGKSSLDLPQHSPPACSQQSFSLPSQFLFELAQPTPAPVQCAGSQLAKPHCLEQGWADFQVLQPSAGTLL